MGPVKHILGHKTLQSISLVNRFIIFILFHSICFSFWLGHIHSPKGLLGTPVQFLNAFRGVVLVKTISWTPNWMSEWERKVI